MPILRTFYVFALSLAFTLVGSLYLPSVATAAPEGLSKKEAKAFDKQVRRYYRKTNVQEDRNDSDLKWVQTPEISNKGTRDSFYYLRAGLKNGVPLVIQAVVRKDYLTTQGIYDPRSMGWNEAKMGGHQLLISASVVTDRSYNQDIQYGFVKLTESILKQNQNDGFTINVRNTDHGDPTEFVIEPPLVVAFLKKYSEETN